jgi:hypothetical protein
MVAESVVAILVGQVFAAALIMVVEVFEEHCLEDTTARPTPPMIPGCLLSPLLHPQQLH